MNKPPPRPRWRANPRIRFAMRLARVLQNVPTHQPLEQAMYRFLVRVDLVRKTCRQLRLAQGREWPAATRQLQQRLADQLLDLRSAADAPRYPLQQQVQSRLRADARSILLELDAAEQEFGEVDVDLAAGTVSVITDPIVLEDVRLGAFRIVIDAVRIEQTGNPSYAVRTVALDPNPASTDESVTHPHVRDDVPCLGDAAEPVHHAILDGRLLDAFGLIRSVLQTYNEGSPYVALDEWDARTCEECGSTVRRDDAYVCDRCGTTLCSDCSLSCDRCQETFCPSHLADHNGESLCPACLENVPEEEDDDEASIDDEQQQRPEQGPVPDPAQEQAA